MAKNIAEAHLDVNQGLAAIANGLIGLEMECQGHLRLRHLRNLGSGRDWIPQPPSFPWGAGEAHSTLGIDRSEVWPTLAPSSNEFALEYSLTASDASLRSVDMGQAAGSSARRTITGVEASDWAVSESRADVQEAAARVVVAINLRDHPVAVSVHTELRQGVPVARRWTTVVNRGTTPILLHRLTSLFLSPRPSAADLDLYWVEAFLHPCLKPVHWRQATVHQRRLGGNVRCLLRSGPYPRPDADSNMCMAWMALRDAGLNEGLFAGWEWSGPFDAHVGDFCEGVGVFGVNAGFSDEGGYSRRLEPGESFTSPVAFLGVFQGDIEDAGRVTRRAAESLFGLPWPEAKPPMFVAYDTWSNWQDFKGNTHHLKPERLEKKIEVAADCGVELFILDYDWFPLLGDFRSDPARFPDGVEAISAKVKAARMKLGLWCGFGQAHPDAPVVREHPEWLVTRQGRPMLGGWKMYALCLGYPPCRDWVLDQLCRIIERFQVDWLKHDFDLIPTSDAHHHAPAATDSRMETVLGYYHIMEKLHERFPNLYLDNWMPATGGADFGNFQRHHSMLMADWYTANALRSTIHGITHLFPHTRLHCYLRSFSKEEERSPYQYRSGFFGNGLYLLNDILQWDEETRRAARVEIGRIKVDRELFIDGETYDLIPKQPDHFGWEARFVYSQRRGRGMAQVFRNHDSAQERAILFKGLNPNADYQIEFVDAATQFRADGSRLMSQGLIVSLPKPFSSEILRLARVSDGS